MGTVISFPPPRDDPASLVLQCDCGEIRYELVGDGSVRCSSCERVTYAARWLPTDNRVLA